MPDARLPATPMAWAIFSAGGRMKRGFVRGLRRDQAHAAHDLDAHRDTLHDRRAGKPAMLGRRQHGGHDDGAGMHRSAFERVVVILAMRGGAVDQRRIIRTESTVMAEGRCETGRGGARPGRCDIIIVARRDAEAGDIQHQEPDGFTGAILQFRAIDLCGKSRQLSGDRHARLALRACAARHSLTSDPIMMIAASVKNAMAMGSSRKMPKSPPDSTSERR